jgi:hypothetical protein
MAHKLVFVFSVVGIIFILHQTMGCKKQKQKGEIGASCTKDSDCKTNLCVDLSAVDDGCTGKVCTKKRAQNEDCPQVAKGRDCDPVKKDGTLINVCLYGQWEGTYCE